MDEFLKVLATLFFAFTVCHYAVAVLTKSERAAVVSGVVFAILVCLFCNI